MKTETATRLYGHWETTSVLGRKTVNATHRCILCGFCISVGGNVTLEENNRRVREVNRLMRRHETEHPKEETAREFFRFKEQLHNSLIPGLDALMQRQ